MLPANCPNCWCGRLENSLQFQRSCKLLDVWHHLSSTHHRSSCWFHQWGCYGRWSLLYMLLLMVSEHVTLSVVQDVPQSTPGAMAHSAIAPSGTTKRTGFKLQTQWGAGEILAGPLPLSLTCGGANCLSGRVCCCASETEKEKTQSFLHGELPLLLGAFSFCYYCFIIIFLLHW